MRPGSNAPDDARVPRVSPAFTRLAATLRDEGAVDEGDGDEGALGGRRGFGSAALTVGGSIFAMPVRGALVVKLPRARVDALVASGVGTPYDPGHGRVMREWVVVDDPEVDWLGLAREARAFVAAAPGASKRAVSRRTGRKG